MTHLLFRQVLIEELTVSNLHVSKDPAGELYGASANGNPLQLIERHFTYPLTRKQCKPKTQRKRLRYSECSVRKDARL